ncbi:MAG: choice-of-anchor L domain-containing protein [Bacteroidales bacterium]
MYAQEHEGVQINKLATSPLGLAVLPIDGVTVTPEIMVEKLIGNGIAYSNVMYTGPDLASGIFSGGNSAGIAVDTGVILSCGLATNALGPNQVSNISEAWFSAGDADLSAITGGVTNDAAVLEFDFVPTEENLEIRFVFGSEEYNEFVFQFNDVFAFFLNGVNIALLPDGITPVSIDNINNGNAPAGQLGTGPCMNCSYYVDNATGLFDTEMDGYTTLLIGSAVVTPGQTHHIKLAIADALDSSLDSWVMIESK